MKWFSGADCKMWPLSNATPDREQSRWNDQLCVPEEICWAGSPWAPFASQPQGNINGKTFASLIPVPFSDANTLPFSPVLAA